MFPLAAAHISDGAAVHTAPLPAFLPPPDAGTDDFFEIATEEVLEGHILTFDL